MAAVQRTRIGYGNEGRTKQLAASLSDFIRLFSLLPSCLPQQNNTPNLLLCPAHGGGWGVRGGSSTGGRFPPLLLLKCTGSGRSAPISALRPARQSASRLHYLRSPTEVEKVCFSFGSSPLSDSLFLPLCRQLLRVCAPRAPCATDGTVFRGRCFKVFSC